MRYLVLISLVALAGCDRVRATTDKLFGGDKAPETAAAPQAAPATDEAPETATPEAEAAPTAQPGDDIRPGWEGARQTVAGLGDPTIPGRWMETALVEQERNGRVVVRKTGATAHVTLIPAGGDPGSGSRLSLEAMRALLAPIDELVELDVYSN
ncbi:hypothetical protein KQ247_03035 [Ruegeria pomeroyi]|uniref:Lipoprotein n=1 Tax=Ruegeria pomeroyi TaxID=89184 RepID=A0A850LIV9_9RHOB|nr:hypothetical protein [Ruegeria pomeroyi]NVK97936.1 hypothetical protein [Ruegeria pomeroyi]NVL03529.1 hypothetical protein [Ruegeria pomeroyi]QWV09599.1 hypothetical protein KQ247_03035 [Ruegeria pomeroyi]